MLQKNCENEIRELSRDQQGMLDEHIDRLNKVFKGKDNYAGIAIMPEKYAPVVRENKEAYYSLTSASKEIPSRIVCMSTMCGMMMTAEEFPVRLHHLSWSITGERLFLQSRWSYPMTDGGISTKRRTGTMTHLEEQRKIKSPV